MRVRRILGVLTAVSMASAFASSVEAAGAGVRIVSVRYNAHGDDDGTKDSLNRERIYIRNDGTERVRIGGWKIHDRGSDNVYTITYNVWFRPGDELYLYTGPGEDLTGMGSDDNSPRTHFWHWNKNHHVWDNGGDTVTLQREDGTVVDRCRYTQQDTTPKRCT